MFPETNSIRDVNLFLNELIFKVAKTTLFLFFILYSDIKVFASLSVSAVAASCASQIISDSFVEISTSGVRKGLLSIAKFNSP